MIGGFSSSGHSVRRALLTLSGFALTFGAADRAHAQSTIRVPGQRPAYSFELEPHVLVTPFEAPDHPSSGGLWCWAYAARSSSRLRASSPSSMIRWASASASIGSTTTAWVAAAIACASSPRRRACRYASRRARIHRAIVFVPVVMQWNFWLHRQWSVFGEPGLALSHRSGGDFGVSPVFGAGGRFHFNDNLALTLRLGYPSFSVGRLVLVLNRLTMHEPVDRLSRDARATLRGMLADQVRPRPGATIADARFACRPLVGAEVGNALMQLVTRAPLEDEVWAWSLLRALARRARLARPFVSAPAFLVTRSGDSKRWRSSARRSCSNRTTSPVSIARDA